MCAAMCYALVCGRLYKFFTYLVMEQLCGGCVVSAHCLLGRESLNGVWSRYWSYWTSPGVARSLRSHQRVLAFFVTLIFDWYWCGVCGGGFLIIRSYFTVRVSMSFCTYSLKSRCQRGHFSCSMQASHDVISIVIEPVCPCFMIVMGLFAQIAE